MKKTTPHWAVERGRGVQHAIATYDVATAVPGPRTVYRASFDFGFEPPSADTRVAVDPAAARLSGSFVSLDVPVPASALADGAGGVIVTLPGTREVRQVAFTSAHSFAGSTVELKRIDKDKPAPQATVSAAAGTGNAASFSGFVDVRLLIGIPGSGLTKSSIAGVTVRGRPTGPRLGLADPEAPADVAFFWPTPDETGTSVSAGGAFAKALQAYLDERAGHPSPSMRLVIQSDEPCRFLLTAFQTGASFALDTFALPALVASDLTDPDALAASIRAAADPVSAHLRAAIGAAPLLAGLNAVIAGGSLYDEQRFAGVRLGARTEAALAVGDDVPRLNRLLLQDAYPDAIAAVDDKRVLRFGEGAVAEEIVRISLPPGATVSKAAITTEASLRADRPVGTHAAGEIEAKSGVHVPANGTAAVAVPIGEAVAATGLALPLVPLSAGAVVAVELQQDWQGGPSGKRLAAGAVELVPGGGAWSSVFFDPVVLPAGSAWIVLRASAGEAVWLATPGTGELRLLRMPDGAPSWESVLPGLEPSYELFSRSGDALGAAATTLRLGGATISPARDGDRTTYDIAAALQSALAGAGGEPVPLAFRSSVAGTITVYPPHVEYAL